MIPKTQRRLLLRSQTTASGGMVPLDGDATNRSFSASSSSSIMSTTSASALTVTVRSTSPITIRVGSSMSVESGLRSRRKCHSVSRCYKPEPPKSEILQVTAYLSIAHVQTMLKVNELSDKKISYMIVVRADDEKEILQRSNSFENVLHTPFQLSVWVSNSPTAKELISYFNNVNEFIAEGRTNKSKCIIITSPNRSNIGRVLAIQQIMYYYNLPYDNAMEHYRKTTEFADELPQNYLQTLDGWWSILKQREREVQMNERRKMSFSVKKPKGVA